MSKTQIITWHNVEDKLPRNKQEVLMAWNYGVVRAGRYFSGKNSILSGFAENKGTHYVMKIGVCKWCKLPKPPADTQKEEV